MFRYRLRTLLILTMLGPPVLAGVWFWLVAVLAHRHDPGRINWSTTSAGAEVDVAVWKKVESAYTPGFARNPFKD